MMATLLPLWLKADDVPEPHPPNWRMDRVFRPVWTDETNTEGAMTFIPLLKRINRSHRGLEDNHRHGRFKAHPALQRTLDTPGPLTLEGDLAERINKIAITQSENGSFELASTRTFHQAVFSKAYQPPTPPPYHPPMIAPPSPLTPLFFPNSDPLEPRNDVPLFLLIGVILATIWRYYFVFVMEDQAFDPRIVLPAVDLAITQAHAQLAEKKRQSEERQPPPTAEPPPTGTNHPI
ncbi:hypothetical protein KI688_012389 [Linnemannia hyalina]|uniref:Uncharacterized protein n=1 Tax=Linnemannia hyalina TaxID=64524 RepID=A0A9P7XXA6_9FUNG|nr:hypothetical protein KI688_012389 [Linnemannia hyalina]